MKLTIEGSKEQIFDAIKKYNEGTVSCMSSMLKSTKYELREARDIIYDYSEKIDSLESKNKELKKVGNYQDKIEEIVKHLDLTWVHPDNFENNKHIQGACCFDTKMNNNLGVKITLRVNIEKGHNYTNFSYYNDDFSKLSLLREFKYFLENNLHDILSKSPVK